jgi:transcriptional regulator with XRE-family HTH domain
MPSGKHADATRIAELLRQGLTQTQVALRLGVSKSVVNRIANQVAA